MAKLLPHLWSLEVGLISSLVEWILNWISLSLGSCPSVINRLLIVCKCHCPLTWQCFIFHSFHLVFTHPYFTFFDTFFLLSAHLSVFRYSLLSHQHLNTLFITQLTTKSTSLYITHSLAPLPDILYWLQGHLPYNHLAGMFCGKSCSYSTVIPPEKWHISRMLHCVPFKQ